MKGFEPSTFAMARRRSSQLSYIRANGESTGRRHGPGTGRSSTGPGGVRDRAAARLLALERRRPRVAERLVALAHSLLEPGLGGPLLEGVALGRVAGDAVEHRAQHLGGMEPLGVEGLV